MDRSVRSGRRARTGIAALVTVAALVTGACTGGSEGSAPSASADRGGASGGLSLLFVQEAAAARLDAVPGGAAGELELALIGVSPRTTWFSDRPQRRTGTQLTAAVTDDWAAVGFAADPPNAALVVEDEPEATNTRIVELRDPRYDALAATLRYRVTVLGSPREGLEFTQGRVAPATGPGAFGAVSLFIDDADAPAAVTEQGTITGSSTSGTTSGTTPGTTPGAAPAATTTGDQCTTTGPVTKPAVAANGAPAITVQGPGTLGDKASSKTLAKAYDQFNTLNCTHYQHTYHELPREGFYYYDCVGFTGYSVRTATPTAWASVVKEADLAPGYVPTPYAFMTFFQGLKTTPQPGWQAVPTVTDLRAGDVLAWITNPTTKVGHSVMALSTPVPIDAATATSQPLPAGSQAYALVIMDSTATPHGPDDTRHASNPLSARNAPLGMDTFDGTDGNSPNNAANPSGLGIGTIALIADAGGSVTGVVWSLGTDIEHNPFGAGRPLE